MGLGPNLPILSHSPIPSYVGYPVGYPISFRLVVILNNIELLDYYKAPLITPRIRWL